MSCVTRCMLRYGLLGGLALGAVALVWPERVASGLSVVREKAEGILHSSGDDPVALRRELKKLADQYPSRIAEVRGEVAEVEHQIAQFERDVDIAKRVVAMATDDLHELKSLVARAEEARSTAQLASHSPDVSIRFDGVRFDIDEAYNEGRRISSVRTTYQDRLATDEQQLGFLREQKDRLGEILGKLEGDFDTYQAQLWQLDRQIDAIQRNDRLIELTEQQQATLDSYNQFGRIDNIAQLEGKLKELRAKQQAQLEHLQKRAFRYEYEERATLESEGQTTPSDPFGDLESLELQPGDADDEEDEPDASPVRRSVAFMIPIVIE